MSNNDNSEMNILKKIMATIRKEARELTDAVLDSGGTKKIENAFESAQLKLKHAKNELTDMMTKHRKSIHVLDIIVENINQHEALISEALNQKDNDVALSYAHKIVDLEHSKTLQEETVSTISTNIDFLKGQLEQSERELKECDRQLTMIKTTEKVQKATDTIMNNIDDADANLLSARKSMKTIREKQKARIQPDQIGAKMLTDFRSNESIDSKESERTVLNSSAEDVIKRIQDKS